MTTATKRSDASMPAEDELLSSNTHTEQLARQMGTEVLARIPIEPRLVQCADQGRPITVSHPDCETSHIYHKLAQQVLLRQNQHTESGNRDDESTK